MNAQQENSPALEVIRRLYDAFARKDFDAFRRLCAPDIVWIQNPGFPGGGTHHGAEAIIRDVFLSFRNEWDGWKYEIDQYLDAGDTIVVLGRYVGTHRTTGKAMSAEAAHVYDVADGLVTRFRQYADTQSIVAAMS